VVVRLNVRLHIDDSVLLVAIALVAGCCPAVRRRLCRRRRLSSCARSRRSLRRGSFRLGLGCLGSSLRVRIAIAATSTYLLVALVGGCVMFLNYC
jgi:hypothetical protein